MSNFLVDYIYENLYFIVAQASLDAYIKQLENLFSSKSGNFSIFEKHSNDDYEMRETIKFDGEEYTIAFTLALPDTKEEQYTESEKLLNLLVYNTRSGCLELTHTFNPLRDVYTNLPELIASLIYKARYGG